MVGLGDLVIEAQAVKTEAAMKEVQEETNKKLAEQEAASKDIKQTLTKEVTALKQANETLKGRFLS